MGNPRVIFNGKLIAKAIGKYIPGFALGIDSFIAAGTAIYDALDASTVIKNLFPISSINNPLKRAIKHPLNNENPIADAVVNHPFLKNDFNFLPLVIPISNRNIAKNPLNISVVNGFISIACCSFAKSPIIRLDRISKTLPFVKECFNSLGTLTLFFSLE